MGGCLINGWLPQFTTFHQLDELQAGVAGALVTVNFGLLDQRDPVVLTRSSTISEQNPLPAICSKHRSGPAL